MRVLFITADDLGLDLWTAPEARHPNLDRIAAAGRVYPIMWGADKCSPCRAKFLTGLANYRDGNLVGENIGATDTFSLDTSSGALLPQLVATWWAGKWHAAAHQDYGHPNAADCQEFRGSMANLTSYFAWERVVNGVPAPCSNYATVQVAADALLGVQALVPLVVAAFHAPHHPWHMPPPELTSFPPTSDTWIQALAMIEAMDRCLWRVVAEAMKREYVVLFCSDNGSTFDGKGTLYDRGLRVPLLAYGPGIAQGTSTLMVQATDIYATILDLLDHRNPSPDALSFVDDLLGFPMYSREFLHHDRWPGLGTPPQLATWDRTVRDARWHLISNDGGAVIELFDLQADPGEATNVAAQYPEEVARLTAELPT